MRGRAFTLIELLVVIAIIAILVGILIPAISKARTSAQLVKSQANLRSLSQIQALYAYDHMDSFTNPFPIPGYVRQGGVMNLGWAQARKQGNNFRFEFTAQQAPAAWYSEMYGFHWYSLTADWLSPGDYQSEIQFSPLDKTLMTRVHDIWINNPTLTIDRLIWDCSYVLTPTAWYSPERYRTNNRTPSARFDANLSQTRRMRFSDVRFPAEKVLLWERFDWGKSTREASTHTVHFNFNISIGTEKNPPQWNNPQAEPAVASIDGSVRRISIRDIYARMWEEEDRGIAFRPTDDFTPGVGMMRTYSMDKDGMEIGYQPSGQGLYPALFWATRDGMQGRDFSSN
ncbi:MAG: type II secretion system protein [Planctomycetes bacterium]|nr:type II secretion system protein [Planctomycetota bacterium]